MYLIGYDIGSSSVKACIIDAETGKTIGSSFAPQQEAPIHCVKAGWAEQNPEDWWTYLKEATAGAIQAAIQHTGCSGAELRHRFSAIGISYQMHGLVCVNRKKEVLRPAIIWCDSRAVPYGNKAFTELGESYCLSHLLNSPGNFTAAKLAWIKENEPEIFEQIYKIMLPGDYIAMRLTGEIFTTVSGLSEGIFWDFQHNCVNSRLLNYFGFSMDLLPPICATFSEQGRVKKEIAEELNIKPHIPITYRAGDQPNNALSLNVFQPGEIASTAGTSGVVYGVCETTNHDPLSRFNTFAHVNHTAGQLPSHNWPEKELTRLGLLLCINGTGILNSWMRRNGCPTGISYPEMNNLATGVPIGSQGLSVIPFGNGAERMLGNEEPGCSIHGINFNIHRREHLIRAAQEGIVFSFKYGIEIMKNIGMTVNKIHAGKANLFLSPIFRDTLAGITGSIVELYNTDGSVGAAKGAGIGAKIYANNHEAFLHQEQPVIIEPHPNQTAQYEEAYQQWLTTLHNIHKP